ncbi:MAG: polyphosphate kinase 2 family protein [Gemmatimonadota bacterium]
MLTPLAPRSTVDLSDQAAAPPPGLPDKAELRDRLAELVGRIDDLQSALFAENQRALLVVLQGRDASGKDGVTRKVFGPLNSQGCVVSAFKKPSELELAHDYLWRVHQEVPRRGTIGVFNRSHYEDVLVVRVHDLVPADQWQRRYDQINAFERMLTENGTTILKFFLHISRKEQKERLLERLEDPTKNWKFNPQDLEERRHWDDFTSAYRDALTRCSTDWAPWYLVPGDKKAARDVLIAEVVVKTLEAMNPKFPVSDPELLRNAKLID